MKLNWTTLPLTGLLLLTGCAEPRIKDQRPNIVVIMADDMGYSDVGAYGGEIETPNIDRLAENGLRFTRYYTNNMCIPSRAALLTGVYHRLALTENGTLRPDAITVAEILRQNGYGTYMAGKWHLAKPGEVDGYPRQRGFDQFYGHMLGASSFFAPATLMRNNENIEAEYQDPDYYFTDAVSDAAVDYVRQAADAGSPFFLYVAYSAAHWPLHAPAEAVAKYKGRYAEGWDALREKRHARMKELGVVPPEWELSPRHPDVPPWKEEPHQEWQQRRMEVYAAQIDVMDQGIGRILAALEQTGRLENTLIAFQIDNGGCHVEYTPDRKGAFLPEATRDGRPMRPGNLPEIMPGPEDTYQSYGYGWANVSNTPFRLFKQHDHEGGILVPLIVHWPRVITAGAITGQVAHVIDLAPTFLEAAGARHPPRFEGQRLLQTDGKSLLPIFQGERRRAHRALYWNWSRGRAVRRDNWKLVRRRDQPWELYDIETDGTEIHDLALDRKDLVEELQSLWETWNSQEPRQRLKR